MFAIIGIAAILLVVPLTNGLAPFAGQSDEVTSLPGLNFRINYKHYSGYLSTVNNTFLHYWFFESETGHSESDPVALWLTGGPGCSSLLGAFTELGPIQMNLNGTLTPNPYSWTQKANVLFLESPAGTGFSYRPNTDKYDINDTIATNSNFGALQSFFKKFPHLATNDFYITGESYAGRYIPQLSVKVLKEKFPVNFKGAAIGNGLVDQEVYDGKSFYQFLTFHGLIDAVPNPIPDFRVGIPVWAYNIYKDCDGDGLGQTYPLQVKSTKSRQSVRDLPACSPQEQLADYLNQKAVRNAIHVRPDFIGLWEACSSIVFYPWGKWQKDMADEVKFMANSGITTVIYYGDVDSVCSFVGGKKFVETELNLNSLSDFETWYTDDGAVGGEKKQFEKNLLFTTVRGAGHMVPEDKPAAALKIFNQFLMGK